MNFTPVEQRVLGCLIEKERATPQNYPLTLNALRLGCNQSSNRDPIVDYDEALIEAALLSLREQGVTRIVYSTANRAAKHRQVLQETLGLGDDEITVLAILLLRGPQTVGEIKGRSERLFSFVDLAQAQATLEHLASGGEQAFVQRLGRRPGQKDARYIHLLGPIGVQPTSTAFEPVSAEQMEPTRPADSDGDITPSLSGAEIERELARLREEVDALKASFAEFRSQFD